MNKRIRKKHKDRLLDNLGFDRRSNIFKGKSGQLHIYVPDINKISTNKDSIYLWGTKTLKELV